jgi:peptidoglycan/LPS O-acetylase OafA/YrhL
LKRIKQIDGLRAVASLLVVSFHYINNQLVNSQSYFGKLFAKLFSFGWAGVDLFFVLSGFLIGSILISNKEKKNYFTTFYVRRFVRIIPTYYLLIFVFLLLGAIPYFKDDYFISGNNIIPTWSYFAMLQNVFMGSLKNMGNSAMSVSWSIGIEEQFYLVIPFLIYFINKRILPYLLVIFIIAANYFRYYYSEPNISFNIPAYLLLPCRMDAISIGVLIAWLNQVYGIEKFVKNYYKIILLSMFLVAAICASLFFLYQDIGIVRNTLFALFFGGLIIIALGKTESLYVKFLSINILTWIGKISYALYLFHYLILGVTKKIVGSYFNFDSSITLFFTSVFAFGFSILFSWLVYKFLETPTVALGKKFNYK